MKRTRAVICGSVFVAVRVFFREYEEDGALIFTEQFRVNLGIM